MPSNSGGGCTPMSSVMIAPNRHPAPRISCIRGASSARSRPVQCGRGPTRWWSVCLSIRSPALTGSLGGTHGMPFAVCGGIGQRIDDLHLLDDRTRPAVGDDERQRIFMFRMDVNEVNLEPIDLGDE